MNSMTPKYLADLYLFLSSPSAASAQYIEFVVHGHFSSWNPTDPSFPPQADAIVLPGRVLYLFCC